MLALLYRMAYLAILSLCIRRIICRASCQAKKPVPVDERGYALEIDGHAFAWYPAADYVPARTILGDMRSGCIAIDGVTRLRMVPESRTSARARMVSLEQVANIIAAAPEIDYGASSLWHDIWILLHRDGHVWTIG